MLAVPSEPLPGDRPRGAPPRTEGAPPPKKAAGPPPATKPATPALAAKASARRPRRLQRRPRRRERAGRDGLVPAAVGPVPHAPSLPVGDRPVGQAAVPAAEPVPQKSPTVTSGSRTLDQVIVEYSRPRPLRAAGAGPDARRRVHVGRERGRDGRDDDLHHPEAGRERADHDPDHLDVAAPSSPLPRRDRKRRARQGDVRGARHRPQQRRRDRLGLLARRVERDQASRPPEGA